MFAWADIEANAWQNAGVIKTFEDRGMPVRIEEGGRTQLNFQVIPQRSQARQPAHILAVGYFEFGGRLVPLS